jgi:uncharacterized protein (DUF697 family)
VSPLSPSLGRIARALPGLVREVGAAEAAPILVAGPPSAAAELARALARDGDPALVRRSGVAELESGPPASAVVYVLHGEPTPTDERALREANRRGAPAVCLVLGGRSGGAVLPYVPATAVVRAGAIDEAAVAAVAERLASRAGEAAWALARGLPVLRRPVARALTRRYARLNAAAAAAVWVPGADLPVLILNQLRMVLRIAAAYGVGGEGARALALAAVAGAGLGFRGLARRAVSLLPFPAFALKGAVAYAGTIAIGEAALAALERDRDGAP